MLNKLSNALSKLDTLQVLLVFLFLLIVPTFLYMISRSNAMTQTPVQIATVVVPSISPYPTAFEYGSYPPDQAGGVSGGGGGGGGVGVAYNDLPYPSEPQTLVDPEQILQDKLQNRDPMGYTDMIARDHILSLLPKAQPGGVLYKSLNFQVEYNEAADQFKVQILTTNTNQAKLEAMTWFQKQGMSQYGACSLPLSFYLNTEVADKYGDIKNTFNPLPDGC